MDEDGNYDPRLANDPPAPWREGDDEWSFQSCVNALDRGVEAKSTSRGTLADRGRGLCQNKMAGSRKIRIFASKMASRTPKGPLGSDPVSATIRTFCSAGQLRRRPAPVNTSSRRTGSGLAEAQRLTYVKPSRFRSDNRRLPPSVGEGGRRPLTIGDTSPADAGPAGRRQIEIGSSQRSQNDAGESRRKRPARRRTVSSAC
jgi:hypothetical protein